MILTDADIHELQALCREHFGFEPENEEARRMGEDLLRLVRLVYEPHGLDPP